MKKTAYTLLPLLLLLGLMVTPLKAQIPHLIFHAELGGSEAIPAVNTQGKGLVTFLFTPDRKKVTVSGMLVRLDGTVTEIKVHTGITGEVGPEILDLLPLVDGRRVVGELDVPPVLLQNLLLNSVYVEVKTTAHPTGEIRGQFICETDLDYGVNLSGNQAIPPNNSSAVAFGGIHFPTGSRDVVYAFVVRGLSGPIIDAGIYEGGGSGQNGTRVAGITGFFGSIIQGLILLDTVDADFLLKAREGKYYVVIKTAAYPEGEIRGQVKHLGYFASLAPVNGVQQVPPPSPPTSGFGFNHTTVNGTLDSLTTTIFLNNILPTSVKIRIAPPGQVGPELVDMGFSTAPGFYSKKYAITEAQLTDFAQGRLYINVTSANFPDGELRGVMKNTLRKGYAFDMCGSQVVPSNNSHALGIAVASVDQADCYINYKLITDGLAGLPTDANISQALVGMNGPDIYPMALTDPIIKGDREIMTALGPVIENGGMYMEISTPGHPDGEIRGQIQRGLSCPDLSGVKVLENIDNVSVSPVPFQDVLNLALKSSADFEGRLVMRDILGIQALTQTVQIVSGEQSIPIPTGNLPKGIYTLALEIPGQNAVVLLKKVVRVE